MFDVSRETRNMEHGYRRVLCRCQPVFHVKHLDHAERRVFVLADTPVMFRLRPRLGPTSLETDDVRACVATDQVGAVEQVIVPTIRGTDGVGWFTDHDLSARSDQACGERDRDVGWSEPASDCGIEVTVPALDRLLDIHRQHDDMIVESESSNHPRQEVGPFGPPVDHRDAEIWPIDRNDQAGHTSAGAEIDHTAGHLVQGGHEVASVFDDFTDWPIPQKAEALG